MVALYFGSFLVPPIQPLFSTFLLVLFQMQTEVPAEMSQMEWFGLVAQSLLCSR